MISRMLIYPQFDPIAFSLGPLHVHWYGLMYLLSFGLGWALALYRAKYSQGIWTENNISDLLFYVAVGVVVGGRIGYMLFYNLADLLVHPLNLFKVWEGGMSFHGGFLGVLLAVWIYARKHQSPTFYRYYGFHCTDCANRFSRRTHW